MRNRKKNAINNVNAGFLNRVVHLFFQFVIRTVMIRTLGSEYLGLSSLFTSILQVLNIAELGFGNAVVFSMYKPFAEKNYRKICALLNYYRRIYYILGTIIFLFGALLTPFLPSLIHGDCPSDVNLYVLYYVYLINTSLGYFMFAYKMSLFIADQRDHIQSNIKTIFSLIMYISQIIVLVLTKNYYAYIVLMPISTIFINVTQHLVSKKDYPCISCNGYLDDEDKEELKKQVTGLISYKIGGVVYENADIVVISTFIGLTQLAIYTNYYYIISGIIALLAIIQSAMTSTIGNSVVTDSLKENVERFYLLTSIYDWIIVFAFCCCACLFQPFMKIWMGEENLLPNTTMLILCFYFYMYNLQPAVSIYKNAAGIWWQDRVRPILSALANIILNIILVHIWGINGVIIASIVTGMFINIPFSSYYLFRNYLKIDFWKYILERIIYMIIGIVICSCTYIICNWLPHISDFCDLCIRLSVCLVIPNLLFLIIYSITNKLNQIIRFTKSVFLAIKHE